MAAITVGDVQVIVRARLDEFRAELSKGATTEGTKAGQKFGAQFAKVGGALAAGAFVLAAKGALELDSAVRRAASAAGIAEDEMGLFRSQVVELFKTNPTKSFQEIADTIGELKTNLGLTTEEAGDTAQAFLDFSKVTGQDGASAVKGLDDILDIFNLDASESLRVMDLLVVSHQKYGGSVTESQDALKILGPLLSGLNLTVDDGVGLLNLFALSGVDAAKAASALNLAVRELKPGQTLNDLIAQVSAIEDPTLRAQKAVDIFGARAGVALASVLRPGIDSLDEFKLSADETAGATSKAADVIDDSFANRITGAIRQVTGSLADLGADAAPVVQTVAGLGAIAGGAKGAAGALFAAQGGALAFIGSLGPLALVLGVAALAVIEITDAAANFDDRLAEVNQKVKDGTANLYDARAAIYAARDALVPTSVAVRDAAQAWGELERAATEAARAHMIGTTTTGLPIFGAAPATASGRASGGSFGGAVGRAQTVNVTVNNPAPEPASQSVEERLRIAAATGIF